MAGLAGVTLLVKARLAVQGGGFTFAHALSGTRLDLPWLDFGHVHIHRVPVVAQIKQRLHSQARRLQNSDVCLNNVRWTAAVVD